MPTVYKWYPGHYLLEAGTGTTANTIANSLIDKIAGTGTNLIPSFRGIQKRWSWRQLEATKGVYNFAPILADLQTLKDKTGATPYPRYLRILLMYKGIGGKGAPDYLRPGNAGYDPAYGDGVYNWNGTANEHPCFWLPAVEERFALFLDAMGAALDSIGRPAGDVRYFLSTVDFNETSWGPTPTLAQATAQGEAFKRLQLRMKAAFPTTLCGHFLNFPNTGTYSVLKVLAPHMRDNGLTLGGPDTWWDDQSVEGPPIGNGVYGYYDDASGLTAISPSVQNQDYNFVKHADATATPPVYDDQIIDGPLGLKPLYDRVTATGTTINGTFRAGLRGTHITWQAAPWRITRPTDGATATGPIIWDVVRNFFLNKWLTGPDAGNLTPGIDAATIPTRLLTGAPPPPPPATLVLALTTDTGASSSDKITSNAAVTVTGATAGATLQYSTNASGPWTTSPPAAAEGPNTWYVRQVVSGTPSAPSAALTFTYDTTLPTLSMATVDGTTLFLTYDDAVGLSNSLRAPISAFQCKVNGVARGISGNFVNEALRRVNLTLSSAVATGQTVTISYTKPATGTSFTQDLAGNAAANLVDAPVLNLTGVSIPTTAVTVAAVGGVGDGGYTNQATPALVGTLSAPLATGETLEIQRSSLGAAFVAIGTGTVTGTDWTLGDATLTEGAHAYRARVRLGELLGPWSATLTVNIDVTPPTAPTVTAATVAYNAAPRITGTWANSTGDVLTVSVGPQSFTTANGLVIVGTNWTLDLPPQPPGRYDLSARTTDRAGNASLSEENADLVVLPQPSINHARLAMARRRP